MKRTLLLFVLVAAILSMTMVASAYYDQNGTKRWCNTDADGCWVTNEDGGKDYIMFWSEASREKYMGTGSDAPIAPKYAGGEMSLLAPLTAVQPTQAPTEVPTQEPTQPVQKSCSDYTDLGSCSAAGCTWTFLSPTEGSVCR